MVISELIDRLEKFKQSEGDIDVYIDRTSKMHVIIAPDIRYCIKGFEEKFDCKMWNWFDGEDNKGKKFIRII